MSSWQGPWPARTYRNKALPSSCAGNRTSQLCRGTNAPTGLPILLNPGSLLAVCAGSRPRFRNSYRPVGPLDCSLTSTVSRAGPRPAALLSALACASLLIEIVSGDSFSAREIKVNSVQSKSQISGRSLVCPSLDFRFCVSFRDFRSLD